MAATKMVERVVLIACGSFNPVTNLHLRMFEVARDYLQATGRYEVVAGIISPVHDNYGKEALLSSENRLEMCRLAVKTSNWIKVGEWEANQSTWTCTRDVLQHYANTLNANSKSLPDAISECDVFVNEDEDTKSGSDLSNQTESQTTRVMLLCGGDLLQSFAKPGLWRTDHIDELTGKFGLAVIRRSDSDADKFIYEQDIVYKNRLNVHVITEWLYNEVSSTKVRRAIRRGESIKYVVQDEVIAYIEQHRLYKS